tara:strand:- start:1105 stop:1362 length:258 start_codon:yes stop_codon:yes gene_type:complete
MSILNKLKNEIINSFKTEESVITINEETALKNLIAVAKERVWMADPIHASDYETLNFETDISTDSVEKIKQSVSIAEQFLEKYKH